MDHTEDLKLRALHWLHEQPGNAYLQETNVLASVFPDGPCLTHDKLDIIVADAEGMLYSVFQSYLTDFWSVLELVDGLGDPDDVYKRKVKKGADCADISSVLAFLILTPSSRRKSKPFSLHSFAIGYSPFFPPAS